MTDKATARGAVDKGGEATLSTPWIWLLTAEEEGKRKGRRRARREEEEEDQSERCRRKIREKKGQRRVEMQACA